MSHENDHGGGVDVDDENGDKQKIKLACLLCRSKKAKCSGDKPRCAQCSRLQLTCLWPDGRRRKRTKREMELESESLSTRMIGGGGGVQQGHAFVGGQMAGPQNHQHLDHAGITALGKGLEEDVKPGTVDGYGVGTQRPHTTGGSWSRAPPPPSSGAFYPPSSDVNAAPYVTGQASALGMGPRRASTPVYNPYLALNTRPWGSFSADAATTSSMAGTAGIGHGQNHSIAVDWDLLLGDPSGSAMAVGGGGGPAESIGRARASSSATSRPNTGHGPDDAGHDGADHQPGQYAHDGVRQHRGSVSSAAQKAKHEAMLASIANQVGYLEGKDDEPYLKVHYFRISGRTSLHPGINRISLKLRLRAESGNGTSSSSGATMTDGGYGGSINAKQQQHDDEQATATLPLSTTDYPTVDDSPPPLLTPHLGPAPGQLFEPDTQMPMPQVYMPLLAIFFDVVAQHFPSVQPKRIYKRIEEGTMSAFLCNAMCAIASRFSPGAKENAAESGNVFMEKCADLLVPLLRLPTTDGVTGLQLMAWCEYALNSESGFWSYTGLAIRMSEDLGFHKDTEEIFEDSGHYVRNKLLFWSLFVTDRLVSFATGRVCSMKEDVIELPLPTDEDMIPRPTPEGTDTTPRPSPFVALVKLMVICGRMSDVLNGNRGAPRTFMPSPPPHLREKITAVQDDLEAFYNNLPPALQWSAATYKHFVSIGQGGVFLTLHCHANALLTLFARPTILFGHDDDAPELSIRSAFKESDRVSLASSRLIAECIVYSDLHSSISYMASPHITQSLYIAGVAFIKEMSAVEPGLRTGDIVNKPGGANEAFLYMVASQNLDIIFKALKKIESVWMGAGVSAYVLSQRAKGLGEGQIDLAESSANIPSFVSVKDAGVLKRFVGKDVSIGTSPSRRSSTSHGPISPIVSLGSAAMAMNGSQGLSLDTLLARYAVDDMYVEPAGIYDPSALGMNFAA